MGGRDAPRPHQTPAAMIVIMMAAAILARSPSAAYRLIKRPISILIVPIFQPSNAATPVTSSGWRFVAPDDAPSARGDQLSLLPPALQLHAGGPDTDPQRAG